MPTLITRLEWFIICPDWQQIKDATEKVKDAAIVVGDDVSELTCSELLEALELSKCLFLMNYIHGSPIIENSSALCLEENAKRTVALLGRILMLDLVIRNEDRLPCRQLGWRGNCANLFFADKVASKETHEIAETFDSRTHRYRPRVIRTLQKERRASSVDGRLNRCIPRRPPAGKRANDHSNYPKLVELLLNSHDYSSSLLYDITWGKLGISLSEEVNGKIDSCSLDFNKIVNEFRGEFCEALGDLQGFHILHLTLHQKLDSLLRVFLTIIDKNSSVDDDSGGISESPSNAGGVGVHFFSTSSKERVNENLADLSDPELQKTAPKSSPPRSKDSPDGSSPISRENWHGRYSKGNGELLRSLRLTAKLRDFNRYAKADIELNKELELWNEMLKTDVIKLCQEKNFNTGFLGGNENNSVFDAYELKVRLEHILETIALISDAGNTERPSSISTSLFIGGALAARSVCTLQHLGITHILCLYSNEIGQSDSQLPELFQYKNFAISDNEDTKISDLFEEACNFIENAEHSGGRVLAHCFEGRSRSATLVLAYLMLRKHMTLLEAHDTLLRVHRRARPNQGFAKALSDLDMELYGKVSLDLQQLHQRRPMMKVCPICEKNVGLTSCLLKHLQKLYGRRVSTAMCVDRPRGLLESKLHLQGISGGTVLRIEWASIYSGRLRSSLRVSEWGRRLRVGYYIRALSARVSKPGGEAFAEKTVRPWNLSSLTVGFRIRILCNLLLSHSSLFPLQIFENSMDTTPNMRYQKRMGFARDRRVGQKTGELHIKFFGHHDMDWDMPELVEVEAGELINVEPYAYLWDRLKYDFTTAEKRYLFLSALAECLVYAEEKMEVQSAISGAGPSGSRPTV
ncbi:hypothetical protein GIB67_039366 [Kingdonia uniflora]|uniref:Dual specificity protein phosphatase PHS1 n=1 Tax=Kingdonia uniflora TaxID=39325 RepID=A0A7J7LX51_9MAGN|nr:hypothetical protein GIB67_039366 [Kingdonia uniflora]